MKKMGFVLLLACCLLFSACSFPSVHFPVPTRSIAVSPHAKASMKPTVKPAVKPTVKPTTKPTVKPTAKPAPTPYKVKCTYCKGTGECSLCGGSGKCGDFPCVGCNGKGKCDFCNGTGKRTVTPQASQAPANQVGKCSICHGSTICQVCFGRRGIRIPLYGQEGDDWVECEGCHGTGKCEYCHGTGKSD